MTEGCWRMAAVGKVDRLMIPHEVQLDRFEKLGVLPRV